MHCRQVRLWAGSGSWAGQDLPGAADPQPWHHCPAKPHKCHPHSLSPRNEFPASVEPVLSNPPGIPFMAPGWDGCLQWAALRCSLRKKHSAQRLALCRGSKAEQNHIQAPGLSLRKRPGRERHVYVSEFWYLCVIPAGGAPAVRHVLIPNSSHFEQVCVAVFF